MSEHIYSANDLLDLELRFSTNAEVLLMIRTIKELQIKIDGHADVIQALKIDLTDILETDFGNLTNALDKVLDKRFPR